MCGLHLSHSLMTENIQLTAVQVFINLLMVWRINVHFIALWGK
jgi:hypothetical protein